MYWRNEWAYLNGNDAKVASIGCVIGQHGRASRDERVDERHCLGQNLCLFWSEVMYVYLYVIMQLKLELLL